MHLIKMEELEQAAKLLTDTFIDYPLYSELFPNERKRWKGVYYCSLIRLYTRRLYTYVDDDVLSLAMIKRPGDTEYPLTDLLSNIPLTLRMLKNIPPRSLARILSVGRVDTAARADHYNPDTDVHMQIICTDKHVRGTKSVAFLKEVCGDSPVYCETHSERNVRLYLHYGFEVCKTTPWRSIKHYAMRAEKLGRPKRETKE